MRVALTPTGLIPAAGGRVDLNLQTGEIRIIATGLPEIETVNLAGNGDEGVYQVWWENQRVNRLGILRKGLDKTHFLNVIVSRAVMKNIKRLIISIERESGGVTPSENVVLTAELDEK